jgi:hypothetical protein
MAKLLLFRVFWYVTVNTGKHAWVPDGVPGGKVKQVPTGSSLKLPVLDVVEGRANALYWPFVPGAFSSGVIPARLILVEFISAT